MHNTIHGVCGQQKGKNRAKSHALLIFFFLVKRAGRHFGFFKRAGHHEKGAGRRALQKKPRQNTDIDNTYKKVSLSGPADWIRRYIKTYLFTFYEPKQQNIQAS